MLINLPFYNPPNKRINLPEFSIKSASESDSATEFPRPVYGFEVGQIPMPKDKPKWAVLETKNDNIPNIIYIALLDLLSGHWKYIFKRINLFANQATFGKSIEYPKVPRHNFTPSLVSSFSQAVKLMSNERKARIAILRWSSSYTREDPLDTVLDCCSALEAAMNLSNELRLRLSLSAYHLLEKHKKRAFTLVYEMYGIRNSFIHGASLPELNSDQQKSYIDIVAKIMLRYIELGKIPNAEAMNKLIMRQFSR